MFRLNYAIKKRCAKNEERKKCSIIIRNAKIVLMKLRQM